MQMHTSRLVVVPLLMVAACTAKQEPATTSDTAAARAPVTAMATDEAAVRRAIDSADTRLVAAVKRADTSAIVAMYTEDAVVMSPNEEAWRGADAVRRGFARFLSQMSVKDGHVTADDVMVAGDLVVETGHYAWDFVLRGGKQVKDKGKYLLVWKRQSDGSLKIVRDISNTDLSAKM